MTRAAPRRRSRWTLRPNARFETVPTYGAALLVPATFTDADLRRAAAARSKGRMAAATWIASRSETVLLRSSMPTNGLVGGTSDQAQLEKYVAAAGGKPGALWIADARPVLNAQVTRLKGGGAEFDIPAISFHNIENIHVMRASASLLAEACTPPVRPFLQRRVARRTASVRSLFRLICLLDSSFVCSTVVCLLLLFCLLARFMLLLLLLADRREQPRARRRARRAAPRPRAAPRARRRRVAQRVGQNEVDAVRRYRPRRCRLRRGAVGEFLLCTVTFYANLADSLTRAP
jgi:hypothetical protein